MAVHIRRWSRILFYGLTGLGLAVVLLTWYLLGTEKGTTLLVDQAQDRVDGLTLVHQSGDLTSGIRFTSVQYENAVVTVSARDALAGIDLLALIAGRIQLEKVAIATLEIVIRTGTPASTSARRVDIGIPIQIEDATIEEVQIVVNKAEPTVFSQVVTTGSLSGDQVRVDSVNAQWLGIEVWGDSWIGLNPPYQYSGQLNAERRLVGAEPVLRLLADGTYQGDVSGVAIDATFGLPDRVAVNGHLDYSNLGIELQARADALELTPYLGTPVTLTAFSFDVAGTLPAYQLLARANIESSILAQGQLDLAGHGTLAVVIVDELRLRGEPGSLTVSGEYDLENQGIRSRVEGVLYQREMSGDLALTELALASLAGTGSLELGRNSLRFIAKGDGDVAVRAALPDLAAFDPALTGSFNGQGNLNLATQSYRFDGRSPRLDILGQVFEGIDVNVANDPDDAILAAVTIQRWQIDGADMGHGNIGFRGLPANGRINVGWQHPAATLALTADAGLSGDKLQGSVTSSTIVTSGLVLESPPAIDFTASAEAFFVAPHCWAVSVEAASVTPGHGGTLCFDKLIDEAGNIVVEGRVPALDTADLHVTGMQFSATLKDKLTLVRMTAESLDNAQVTLHKTGMSWQGTADRWHLEVQAEATTSAFSNMPVHARARALSGVITLEEARLQLPQGHVGLNGQYDVATTAITAALSGQVLGNDLLGDAEFSGASLQALTGRAAVVAGVNRLGLTADGAGNISATLEAPELSSLSKSFGGELHGFAQLREGLLHESKLTGSQLRYANQRIGVIDVQAKKQGDGNVLVRFDVSDWRYGSYQAGSGNLVFTGVMDDGHVDFAWQLPGSSIALSIDVALDDEVLSGTLQRGSWQSPEAEWQVSREVNYLVSARHIEVDDHCWQSGASNLCASGVHLKDGLGQGRIMLNGLPLDIVNIPFSEDVAIRGVVAGEISGSIDTRSGKPVYAASGSLQLPGTSIRYFGDQELRLDLSAGLLVENNRLTANISGDGGLANHFHSHIEMPDVSDYQRMTLNTDLVTDQLGIITAFLPQLDKAQGSAEVKFDIDTVTQPAVADILFQVTDDASVVIPAAGITLSEISLSAQSRGEDISINIAGRSGTGRISAIGSIRSPLTDDRSIDIDIKGESFEFLNRPDVSVVSSPDLNFRYDSDGTIRLTGKLAVVDGEYRAIDFGTQARTLSSDVVVVAAESQTQTVTPIDLNLDVRVEKFRVNMYGLTGDVAGAVTLTETPGSPRRAVGNMNLGNGTFERFGQTFTVERGRLIFSGPLNNPLVDVVSTRTIKEDQGEVKVSLLLTGPADKIKSTVTSVPAMSEARALSYLIVGRSLDTTGATESNALSSAAIGLGLRQAAPITNEIKSTLGLTELTVESTGVDSTSVIAGKKIGEALYVEYNYDVFSNIGGILFSYQLTPKLSLQTRSGESSSMQLVLSL